MKKFILSAALLLGTIFSPLSAQDNTDLNMKSRGSDLVIEFGGYGIVLGEKEKQISTKEVVKRVRPRARFHFGIVSMSLGFNSLTNVKYSDSWKAYGDPLELHMGKSIRFVWEVAAVNVPLNYSGSSTFSAGIRFGADNFRFSNPVTLRTAYDGNLMPEPLYGNISKSKMTVSWFGIPMGFHWEIAPELWLSANVTPEIKMEAHTKYKSPKTKATLPGISPVRVLLGGSLTYYNIGIYCDYAPTPFFKDYVGTEANTFSIGIKVGL